MTTTTIKTNKGETLNITKGKSLSWYNTHAYGMTKKVVWHDEDGGMWVKMNGKFIEACYHLYGRIETYVDETGVEPIWGCGRYAYEL